MRKFFNTMVFGCLSKDIAGTRPLTDKERRSLLMLIYSSVGFYLWYWYKNQRHESDHIEGNFRHEDDFKSEALYGDDFPDFPETPQTVAEAFVDWHTQHEEPSEFNPDPDPYTHPKT